MGVIARKYLNINRLICIQVYIYIYLQSSKTVNRCDHIISGFPGRTWPSGPDQNINYDWFQRTAFACVEFSDSVLVAAPTSAGKTAVALYAIRRCMAGGCRCVYTAPIKALSNEKFCDFCDLFGATNVALLTGDARAGRLETAKIVVMTTEVLVSLLHNEAMLDEDVEDVSSRSALMQSLSCAVFDEIHYIADEERGTAWEECIVLLERHVQLIGLSATVPNFLHLAAWIAQTRHTRCHGIFSRRRPVPLVHGVVPCPPANLVEVTTIDQKFKFKAYQATLQLTFAYQELRSLRDSGCGNMISWNVKLFPSPLMGILFAGHCEVLAKAEGKGGRR